MVDEKKPVILFVNAPSMRAVYKEDRCQIDANDLLAKFYRPPISLMLLAGIAETSGFETRILDCPVQGYSFIYLKGIYQSSRPSIVVVNTSEQTEREDILTLRLAKHAGAKTIAFGYQATTLKTAFFSRCPWVDIIIVKEPEMSLKDVLEGKELDRINGICYVDKEKREIENPERPFISNLDVLPFSSHHLIDFTKYRYPFTGKPFTVIQVSRGCPFACKFCLAPFLNGIEFRGKSVKKVLDEIEYVVKNFHVSTFFLRADTFTINKEWIRQFCTGVINKGLDIQWFTNSRIDTIPEGLIPLMSAAGCTIIGIGIESGIPTHQKMLRKNINLSLIGQKLRALNASKIQSVIYFLIGHPFDTVDTIRYNIHYSRKIPATFVEFTLYVDFDAVDLKRANNQTRFPEGFLKKIAKQGEFLFYFRLKKMLEIMTIVEGNIIRNPSNFPRLMLSSFRALRRFFLR
jgi:anaerobic magnesium-protoporphyrin IX monomethyl ester cyclase